jgi:predicted membrane protein
MISSTIITGLIVLLALYLIFRRSDRDSQVIWILPFPLFIFFNRYFLALVIVMLAAAYLGANEENTRKAATKPAQVKNEPTKTQSEKAKTTGEQNELKTRLY